MPHRETRRRWTAAERREAVQSIIAGIKTADEIVKEMKMHPVHGRYQLNKWVRNLKAKDSQTIGKVAPVAPSTLLETINMLKIKFATVTLENENLRQENEFLRSQLNPRPRPPSKPRPRSV